MSHTLHTLARTTPKTRAEIQASREAGLTQGERRRHYSVGKSPLLKWQRREEVEDRSHRAHILHPPLSAAREMIVTELCRLLEWPLDDPRVITQRFIDPEVSRSGLNRLLQREGLVSLRALAAARARQKEENEATARKKGFREYAPGFIPLDIKYLPKMPEETSRRYLFVAIDRASRWVFLHIHDNQSQQSSLDFLKCPRAACPIHIRTILTDSGTPFTDRFTSRPTAGSNASRAVSANSARKPALQAPRNSNKRGRILSWRITPSSRNKPSATDLPSMPSPQDTLNTLNCSIRRFIIRWNETTMY